MDEEQQYLQHEQYQPYLRAVKQVLDGSPVKELDDIRQQCNDEFLASNKLDNQGRHLTRYSWGYDAELVMLTFFANAENKILMGAKPAKEYGKLGPGIEPENWRRMGRSLLEIVVGRYLK
ncbi:hypothetical protein JXB28_02310 [Candidatus Woesearchaeota archaeon]|nr:hypothetical protein [Candidatus Woesearchaeota archaeon]